MNDITLRVTDVAEDIYARIVEKLFDAGPDTRNTHEFAAEYALNCARVFDRLATEEENKE